MKQEEFNFSSEHKHCDGLGYKSHSFLFLATWKQTLVGMAM